MDITMLKEHLGEELYAQAAEKLNAVDGLQVIAAHDGTWLPKARLDEEIARRKELQSALDGMAGKVKDCAELRAQVDELTRRLESGAAREALLRAGARDADLVAKLLSGEGTAEEQIAALKKRSPYLFEDAPGTRAGFGGGQRARADGGHADVYGAIRAAAGRGTCAFL